MYTGIISDVFVSLSSMYVCAQPQVVRLAYKRCSATLTDNTINTIEDVAGHRAFNFGMILLGLYVNDEP